MSSRIYILFLSTLVSHGSYIPATFGETEYLFHNVVIFFVGTTFDFVIVRDFTRFPEQNFRTKSRIRFSL